MDASDYQYLEQMAMELRDEEADELWFRHVATAMHDQEDIAALEAAERDYADIKALENAERQVTFARHAKRELDLQQHRDNYRDEHNLQHLAWFIENECKLLTEAQKQQKIRLWNWFNSRKEFYELGLWPEAPHGYGNKGYSMLGLLLVAPKSVNQRFNLMRFLLYNGLPFPVAKDWVMITGIDDNGQPIYHQSSDPAHLERHFHELLELASTGKLYTVPEDKSGTVFDMRLRTPVKLKKRY